MKKRKCSLSIEERMTGNFRNNYLEKIGGLHSANKWLQEQLSEDCNVDLATLALFTIKYPTSALHRLAVWKLLLHVTPSMWQAKTLVSQHRTEQANLLYGSLRTMRKLKGEKGMATAEDIVRMIQLEKDVLPLVDRPFSIADQAILAIASRMIEICDCHKGDWRDAYWLTKNFSQMLCSDATFSHLISETRETLSKMSESVSEENFGNWDNVPLSFWMKSGCAGLFSRESLEKIWDKAIADREGIGNLFCLLIVEFVSKQMIETGAIWPNVDFKNLRLLSTETEDSLVETILQSFSLSRSDKYRKNDDI